MRTSAVYSLSLFVALGGRWALRLRRLGADADWSRYILRAGPVLVSFSVSK